MRGKKTLGVKSKPVSLSDATAVLERKSRCTSHCTVCTTQLPTPECILYLICLWVSASSRPVALRIKVDAVILSLLTQLLVTFCHISSATTLIHIHIKNSFFWPSTSSSVFQCHSHLVSSAEGRDVAETPAGFYSRCLSCCSWKSSAVCVDEALFLMSLICIEDEVILHKYMQRSLPQPQRYLHIIAF